MLLAKKDANRAEPASPKATSPGAGAVGKVVNSIQGLQQRLNDYTLEEIANAENTSRTLLLGLSSLQSRVGSLARIKRALTAAREAVDQAGLEDFKPSTLEISDKPLHLHEILQASNLIKFPILKKISHHVSMHTVQSVSDNSQISPVANDQPKFTENAIKARPAADRQETSDCLEGPPFIFDAEQIGTASPIPSADFSWDEQPGGTPGKNITDELNYNQEIQTNAVKPKAEVIKPADFDMSAPESDPVMPRTEEPNASLSTALVPTGGDFDQRLLDDLIKSYGEFFSSADSRSKIEPQAKIETADVASAKIFLEAPAAEGAKDNTARTLPLKKEGDIDRQLKKIIKDYGEYDIYSRPSPINIKSAVIGAFLLLGAVFSGFYFLSSPKSQEPASPPATAQPASTMSGKDTSGIRNLKRSSEASEANTLNKSSIVKK
jgi:hypothetical protein